MGRCATRKTLKVFTLETPEADKDLQEFFDMQKS